MKKHYIKNSKGLSVSDSAKGDQGFTLVEILIYIVLFAMLSIFLIDTLVSMVNSYKEVRINDDILDAAHVSMERMSREIRDSISADTSTSSVLLLNTTDASGTAKTVQFDLSGNALEFIDNGVSSGNLTGSHVSVTSLTFRKIVTSASTTAVRVEMSIQSLRSLSNETMQFTDTIEERGSY